MSLGSFTRPPTFTGPSGLISGAGGDATSDEPITPRSAPRPDAAGSAAPSSDGAASASPPPVRCELTGWEFKVSFIISDVTCGASCLGAGPGRFPETGESCFSVGAFPLTIIEGDGFAIAARVGFETCADAALTSGVLGAFKLAAEGGCVRVGGPDFGLLPFADCIRT